MTPQRRPAASSPTRSFIGSKIGQHSQIITGTVCTDFGRRWPAPRATIGDVKGGGWFEYGPGPVRLRRPSALSFLRGGPFRMVELNVVGWAALLAPPALAGGVAPLVVGWHPTVGALAGAGAALVVAVAWDRWRWRNSVVSVSSDVDLEQLRRVAERLRAEGIDVTVDAADPGRSWRQTQTARTSTAGGSPHVSAGSTVSSPPWSHQRLRLATDEHTGRQAGASPGVPPGVRRCRELSPPEPDNAVTNAKAATLPARRTPGVHDRPLLSARANARVPAVAIDLPHRRVGPLHIAGYERVLMGGSARRTGLGSWVDSRWVRRLIRRSTDG